MGSWRPRRILLAMEYYLRGVHEGVVRYARQAEWDLDQSAALTVSVPKRWRGEGVIALLRDGSRSLQSFRGVPIVGVLDGGAKYAASVFADDLAAGRLAAEHLLERGFRRFAFLQAASLDVVDARREGFCAALREAGFDAEVLNYDRQWRRSGPGGIVPWLVPRLRKLATPVGILASGDHWAVQLLNACRHAGLEVPEQVAVIGIDNDRMQSDATRVGLTSVDNNLEGVGYEAAAILDRILDGKRPPRGPIIVPPRGVVTRQSTDILAVENVHVARALAYLFAHYHEPIRVGQVAKVAGLSLRRLQVQFRRAVGRGLVEELTRLRLIKAQELLRTTRDKAEYIALDAGFSSGKYMSTVFRSQLGMTPSAYRRGATEKSGREQSSFLFWPDDLRPGRSAIDSKGRS